MVPPGRATAEREVEGVGHVRHVVDHSVGAESAGDLAHPRLHVVGAELEEVGGAELLHDLDLQRVASAADDDDVASAGLLGGHDRCHGAQTGADDDDIVTGLRLGDDGAPFEAATECVEQARVLDRHRLGDGERARVGVQHHVLRCAPRNPGARAVDSKP